MMNHPLVDNETLRELIAALRDGRLTDDQASRLNAALANEPSAREMFARYALLQATLELEMGATSPPFAEPAAPQSVPTPSGVTFLGDAQFGTATQVTHGWPLAYLIAAVTCGLGLLVGSLISVSGPPELAGDNPPTSERGLRDPGSAFVGRITGMVECQWADSSMAAFNGAHVPLGRKYVLTSGLMEITYRSGATVILQGPVTYEVDSPAGGHLTVGKLTARVEKKEERRTRNEELSASRSLSLIPHSYFAVHTPTATVTDLGTEFGVEVAESGATSTSVFRGAVEVQPRDNGRRRGQPLRLTENQSASVVPNADEATTVRFTPESSLEFVRAEQFSRLAKEQRLVAFRRWQTFSQELRRDPSLLAYYDFQQKPGSPTVLSNVAANSDSPLDGVIENATWSNGRVPGKHALLFFDPSAYVRINLPQHTDDLTLAAWVSFDWLDVPSANALLMSDGWDASGKVCWQIGADRRACFSTMSAIAGSGNAFATVALGPEQLRRWIHLACVYDHEAKCVRFYQDGCNVGEVEYQTNAPVAIGLAQIGNWNPEDIPHARTRNFHGQMDELAIFRRPLNADEVQRMYMQGKP